MLVIRILMVVAAMFVCGAALAKPPASCAGNFVGSWRITVTSTGQTYVGEYRPDGAAIAHCPFCAPGTWTCDGNVITVFVNSQTVRHTLSSNRTRLEGGCCVATRIGAPPAAPARQEATGNRPAARGQIPESCLVTRIEPTAIPCERPNTKGSVHNIFFSAKKGSNCPKDFSFTYKDPNNGENWNMAVPIRMTMCGNHPIAPKIVQPQ